LVMLFRWNQFVLFRWKVKVMEPQRNAKQETWYVLFCFWRSSTEFCACHEHLQNVHNPEFVTSPTTCRMAVTKYRVEIVPYKVHHIPVSSCFCVYWKTLCQLNWLHSFEWDLRMAETASRGGG
jgi:hypothetical protein